MGAIGVHLSEDGSEILSCSAPSGFFIDAAVPEADCPSYPSESCGP